MLVWLKKMFVVSLTIRLITFQQSKVTSNLDIWDKAERHRRKKTLLKWSVRPQVRTF